MPRTLSSSLKQAVFAPETSETLLVLLTITHADLASPIRVVRNTVDVVSGGQTFQAYPFELRLPDDSEDRPPAAELAIDNVSRDIAAALRSITSAPGVRMQIVLASDPDTVEVDIDGFELTNVQIDALQVQGRLELEEFGTEPFPAGRMTPGTFPGLF